MLIQIPRGWEIPEREATPEGLALDRRRFLASLGAVSGALLAGVTGGADDPATSASTPALGAQRNAAFRVDGALTDQRPVARYNNFYEFTQEKDVYRYVEKFETRPWIVEVGGLVAKPKKHDVGDLLKFPLEERLYRHRCVEAWYMDVPWIGFPLHKLLAASEPLAKARYVKFTSFVKKAEAPGQQKLDSFHWPYYEAARLDEAMNELCLATVGIYGHELPKQQGAPFRVVFPWKYGFKGPKSVVKIELVKSRPPTFWNDLYPDEYTWESNVNPAVPHPRWSQAMERSIDGAASRKTRYLNGYEAWVGDLYAKG
jgi:sulfoxide reductase catalytic subunit YedY